jgi:FAD:protein FMN transferase
LKKANIMQERYQTYLKALGSDIYITLISDQDSAKINIITDNLIAMINRFEQQFSRFLKSSELTNFNNNAGKKIAISNSFKKLLVAAKEMSLETKGLYNPFILPDLQKAGYLTSMSEENNNKTINDYRLCKIVSIDKLDIDQTTAKIPKNTALDFGGIGKGYLLGELGSYLKPKPLSGYWISLGGDILCSGYDLNNANWQIAIQNAQFTNKITDYISNKDGATLAIATSGITKRKGINNGITWHHIIDPRTSMPVENSILTVTVTSKNPVFADIYAKCIIIDGEKSVNVYKRLGKIDSYLIQFKEQPVKLNKVHI